MALKNSVVLLLSGLPVTLRRGTWGGRERENEREREMEGDGEKEGGDMDSCEREGV